MIHHFYSSSTHFFPALASLWWVLRNSPQCSREYKTVLFFALLILTEQPSKLCNWCHPKTFCSFKILIYDFHKQNDSFHYNSILFYKHGHRCYNYRHHTTMLISRITNHEQQAVCRSSLFTKGKKNKKVNHSFAFEEASGKRG